MHRESLPVLVDRTLSLGDFRVLLTDAIGGVSDTTSLAEILDGEPFQAVGEYNPQNFTYTAGTSTYDATSGYQKAPDVTVEFSSASVGFSHTHVLLWQGRGTTANKQISSIDTSTDVITVTAHGLLNGDRAFIRSTGSLPGGALVQRYYVKATGLDTLELYTDSALTTKVNLTSTGSGTLYLQYATGNLFDYTSNPGSVNAGQTKSFIVSYQLK